MQIWKSVWDELLEAELFVSGCVPFQFHRFPLLLSETCAPSAPSSVLPGLSSSHASPTLQTCCFLSGFCLPRVEPLRNFVAPMTNEAELFASVNGQNLV